MQLTSPSLPVDPTSLPSAATGLPPGLGAPAGGSVPTAAFGSVLASAQSASADAAVPTGLAGNGNTNANANAKPAPAGDASVAATRPAGLTVLVRTAAKTARGTATTPASTALADPTTAASIDDDEATISPGHGHGSGDASESGPRHSRRAPSSEPTSAAAAVVLPTMVAAPTPAPLALTPAGESVPEPESVATDLDAVVDAASPSSPTAPTIMMAGGDATAPTAFALPAKPAGSTPVRASSGTDATTAVESKTGRTSAARAKTDAASTALPLVDALTDAATPVDLAPARSAALASAAGSRSVAAAGSAATAADIPSELQSDPSTGVELKSFSVTPSDASSVPAANAPATDSASPSGSTDASARLPVMDAKRSLTATDAPVSDRTPAASTSAAPTPAATLDDARSAATAPAVTPHAAQAMVVAGSKTAPDAPSTADLADSPAMAESDFATSATPVTTSRRGATLASDRSNLGAEKIAATRSGPTAPELASDDEGSVKKSVSVAKKQVADGYEPLGTNAAKSGDLMSSAPASPHASVVHPGRDVATSPVTTETPAPTQPQLADAARRTVETVMIGADRYAADAKAVNLHFTVSGVDLAVHVALRGDEIHTTFRTDSPELRTALAQQWQEVAGDRSERMAAPVFSSSHSGSNLTGGDAQSRDSSARQQPQASTTPWASTFARATTRSAAGAMPAAVSTAPSRPATTRLLHAFA